MGQNYHRLIPFGFNCAVANQLKKQGKRREALPFDWLRTLDLPKLVDLLLDDCRELLVDLEPAGPNLLEIADLDAVTEGAAAKGTPRINRKYQVELNHYDPVTIEEHRLAFERRIPRLYEILGSGQPVALVRLCSNTQGSEFGQLDRQRERIKERWPNADLLLIVNPTMNWQQQNIYCGEQLSGLTLEG